MSISTAFTMNINIVLCDFCKIFIMVRTRCLYLLVNPLVGIHWGTQKLRDCWNILPPTGGFGHSQHVSVLEEQLVIFYPMSAVL